MATFKWMTTQEEVVWTNHYGPLCSMFNKYKMTNNHRSFFVVFIGHHG